jgi:hypothetical protein
MIAHRIEFDVASQHALDLSANAHMLLTRVERAATEPTAAFQTMNTVRAVPNSAEDLRAAAHNIAKALCASDVGGGCYHGGQHTCFTRQGRRPLPLYKVEELCERCAASWHAVMTASLLDSVVIGQQFLGVVPNVIEQQLPHDTQNSNGAARFADVRAERALLDAAGVKPNLSGKYSADERTRLATHYQSLTREMKAAFNLHYKTKAWQLRDWAKK